MTRRPERSCLGCGRKRPQDELVRLALDEGGRVFIDGDRRAKGRGGYLCGSGCLQAAVKRKALGRAFRGKLKELDPARLEAGLRTHLG